jgi:hypothetical protein
VVVVRQTLSQLKLAAAFSWIMTIIYANRETYWWTGVLPDMLSVESSP